ncbi:carbohydrate-binding protein [Tenacibaculum agarivorans]|uniref:carbohydrate-binding protein n=1 Tax=Tenacibaculum agarivorans TaxID=1908389 RepID=UPI00094B7CBC|nr:carbohydrate-binding protein [Tenacibaculum agarivorans]
MFKSTKINCLFLLQIILITITSNAQLDFDNTPLPSRLGNINNWNLIESSSDDFNYSFNPTNNNADFGPPGKSAKWNNFYHNAWDGPGATKWQRNHVAVSGGNLNIWASRRFFDAAKTNPYTKTFEFNGANVTRPETISGCITSKTRVKYPVFVEAELRVMNSSLATDIWLLSPDDTQEIDIIEAYGGGGNDGRNNFFAERIHLSHHVFTRSPFRDYQPSDWNSWYRQDGVNKWGGRNVRIGIYWKSPTVLEYYIDGQLVRVLDNDAIASRLPNGTWEYTYPGGVTSTGVNGQLVRETSGFQSGFQKMTVSSTSSNFNQNNLNTAKNQSNISVLDPFNYLSNGRRFTKELDIIINVEDQTWQTAANRSPNNTEIQNFDNNLMLVDWIRVYKPKNNSGGGDNDGGNNGGGNNNTASIPGTIQAENYNNMNGVRTENTSDAGGGQNVGYIDNGDWMDYNVNVATAGTYTVNFRVAARTNNILFNVRSGNSVLTSVNSSATGGWQNWKTVSATVNLPAGSQTLRVQATGGGWNINWMQFVGGGNSGGGVLTCANAPQFNGNSNSYSTGDRVINGGILYEKRADGQWNLIENCGSNRGAISSSTATKIVATLENENIFSIYPNPVSIGEKVTIKGVYNDIVLFDFSGKEIINKATIYKDEVLIDTANLAAGIYFIHLDGKKTHKLIVK